MIIGAARYLVERRRELAWAKTRFIVELFEDFDQDAACQRAKDLIDFRFFSGDSSYLADILASGGNLTAEQWKDRACIDHYLDFFDRLYTHVDATKTLALADVKSFWGYVRDIYDTLEVLAFAIEWGYEDVVSFAEDFDVLARQREKRVTELRVRIQAKLQAARDEEAAEESLDAS